MATREYIRLLASEVPTTFQTIVDGKQYTWTVNYNEEYDFYSVDVRDSDGEVVYSTKLVIGNDMMHAGTVLELTSELVPRDYLSGESERVGADDLEGQVKIYVEA